MVCQLDALRGCLKPREIRIALKSLPKTLDETYARILAKIPEEHSEDARRILQCLISAFYPLDVKEVAEIVAINPFQDPIIDFDSKLYDPQDVLTICSSLVSVIPSTRGIVDTKEEKFPIQELRLAHYSVKEYLISNRVNGALAPMYSIDERLAHDAMAGFCLRYLLQFDQDDLGRGLPGSQYGLLENALFAPYATRCWGRHFRAAAPDMSSSSHRNALALTKDQRIIRNALKLQKKWWEFDNNLDLWGLLKTDTINPLYYASLHGLTSVMSTLLGLGEDVHSLGPRGTALAAACSSGHADAVRLLLQAGANIELDTSTMPGWRGKGRTPLDYAVSGKHVSVVELLLAEGADVNHPGPSSQAAIIQAVYNKDITIARLLISAGADVNKFDKWNPETPLQIACEYGDEGMVDLILSAGAPVNDEPSLWGNSLTLAMCGGNVSIINKLQNLGGYLVLCQNDYFVSNYLPTTSCEAQTRAKHLLSMNIFQDPQQKALVQSSLLRVAVQRGFEDLVSMMLQIGTDVNLQDMSGETPLMTAAKLTTSGSLFFMRLLLQHGADVNKIAGDNRSALYEAAVGGNVDVVDLLLENGADVNCGSWEESALGVAIERLDDPSINRDIEKRARHQAVIDTLLAHGAQDISILRRSHDSICSRNKGDK